VTHHVCIALFTAIVALSASAAAPASPHLDARPLVKTNLPLGDVVATNGHVLYIAEHTGQVDVGGLEGSRPKPFVTLPREG